MSEFELPELPGMDITAQELVAELIEQQALFERQPGEFTNEDYIAAQQAALGDKAKGRETCRGYLKSLVAKGKLKSRVVKHVIYYKRADGG
jgi:hypothetical protein